MRIRKNITHSATSRFKTDDILMHFGRGRIKMFPEPCLRWKISCKNSKLIQLCSHLNFYQSGHSFKCSDDLLIIVSLETDGIGI